MIYKEYLADNPEPVPDEEVYWSGRVLAPPIWVPPGFTICAVSRPRTPKTGEFRQLAPEYEPQVMKIQEQGMDLHTAPTIQNAQRITVKRVVDKKQFTREVAASAKLIYRDDLMPSLLATNSLALPKVDLFRTVRREDKPEVQNFKESLEGNLQQTKIVECLSSLPGRIVAIQGPAGSGKTVIAIHGIVLPLSYFARDPETPSLWEKDAFTDAPKTGKARHQVILLAPQNPVCDNLAMKADEVLMDHAEEQLTRRANGKPPLVIRLHQQATEGTFVRKDLPKVPKGPPIFDDENPDFVDIATDTISFAS
jgi:hypothetical protein